MAVTEEREELPVVDVVEDRVIVFGRRMFRRARCAERGEDPLDPGGTVRDR
jgi:hypothetical protein